MTSFYICKTCNLVIAGSGAVSKHRANKHSVASLDSLGELRMYGIARDPEAQTSSINTAEKMSIAGLRKRIVFIGKSGKQVRTRREGSRVDVKYEYVDEYSGVAMELTEQDYFKVLFSDGIPSVDLLHTFNNKQYGSDHFESMLLTTKTKFALVTLDPDDANNLIFAQDYSYGSRGNELSEPYAQFYASSYSYNKYKCNIDTDKQRRLYELYLCNSEEVIYYDLLAPRATNGGAPYLTRVLITVHHSEEAIKKYSLDETKQFVLYEIDEDESNILHSRSSYDWATNIVQDARSILCSRY